MSDPNTDLTCPFQSDASSLDMVQWLGSWVMGWRKKTLWPLAKHAARAQESTEGSFASQKGLVGTSKKREPKPQSAVPAWLTLSLACAGLPNTQQPVL